MPARLLPITTILAFLALTPPAWAQAKPADKVALDTLLAEALTQWQAPGVGVVVVRDDEVIYLRGTGVKKVGSKDAVTADTVFPIGSLTKAMTATTYGLLVADGKAGWDDKVGKHVPFFHLADPLADKEVTIRDLLCHRTGVPRHDLLWHGSPLTLEESIKRMTYLELEKPFRSAYLYNNLCYIATGFAIESVAKKPWHEFMRERLFEPLGMKGVVFTSSDARKTDHASPHRRGGDGKAEAISWYNDDKQIRASGSVKASPRAMALWLRAQLNDGMLGGKRVIPAAVIAEMRTPQIVVPLEKRIAKETGATQSSYGLGWRISDYRGKAIVEHGGSVDGFRARVLLFPKDKLGILVLTNLSESGMPQALTQSLADALLGLEKKDWNAFYLATATKEREAEGESAKRRLADRKKDTKPSCELAAFAGTYEDKAYGTVKIDSSDKGLVLTWGNFKLSLEHFHDDTFVPTRESAPPSRIGSDPIAFKVEKGTPQSLRWLSRTFMRTTK